MPAMVMRMTTENEELLEARVREAIAETLPAQQVDWLRARLEEADQLEDVVKRLTEELAGTQRALDRCVAERDRQADALATHAHLDDREDNVETRERAAKRHEDLLQLKEQHTEQRLADHRDLVALVFKSPTFRTVQTGNVVVDGGEYATGHYDNAGVQQMGRAGATLQPTTTTTETSEQ